MSSTTNIPINTRSMNGIITISDGIATMENGSLTNVSTLSASTVSSNTLNSSVLTTTTQPTADNSTNVATTAFVQNNLLLVPKLSNNNTFTGIETFTTASINTSPLVVNSTYLSSNNAINFSPYTSDSTYNPFVQEGDAIIYTDNTQGLVIGLNTSEYTGFRINSTSIQEHGKNALSYYVSDSAVDKVFEMLTTSITAYLPFYSNYVDMTNTIYENQFLGDIYGFKALTSKNGFYIKSSPGAGATTYLTIDSSGNIQNEGTLSTKGIITTSGGFNNLNGGVSNFSVSHSGDVIGHTLTVPDSTSLKFVVDSGGNINNCNTISIPNTTTPSFKVNGTGDIQYCNTINIPNHTSPTFKVDNVGIVRNCSAFYIPDSTTPLFKVASGGSIDYCKGLYVPNLTTPLLSITSAGNMTAQTINCNTPTSSDNSTLVATTAFVKNQNYAQLSGLPQTFLNSNTFSQSITGVTEATADNSTKVATTAFVKNQGYSILNASNSFTGQQTLTNASNSFPLRVKSSTAVTTREGCHFVATANGAYNSITTANDAVILGRDTSAMDAGVLTLTTHSNTPCGIRITNNSVDMTGTTIQTNGNLKINNSVEGPSTNYATTSFNIGYVNHITSFTTPSGNGVNVLGTYIFDNTTTNYAYGTYLIVTNIRCTPATAGAQVKLSWSTQTTVMTGLWLDSQTTLAPNVLKITVPLQAYTTQTWYLLFQVVTGTYTFNSVACSLDIIRIA